MSYKKMKKEKKEILGAEGKAQAKERATVSRSEVYFGTACVGESCLTAAHLLVPLQPAAPLPWRE